MFPEAVRRNRFEAAFFVFNLGIVFFLWYTYATDLVGYMGAPLQSGSFIIQEYSRQALSLRISISHTGCCAFFCASAWGLT